MEIADLPLSDQLDFFKCDFNKFLGKYTDDSTFGPFDKSLLSITELYPLNDPETRRDNLFIWILRAVCLSGCRTKDEMYTLMDSVIETVKEKNEQYGNSALTKSQFYRGYLSTPDTILVRMEDKIRRYSVQKDGDPEDTVRDFIGYAILLYIALFFNNETLLCDRESPMNISGQRPVLVIPGRASFGEIRELIRDGNFDIYYSTEGQEE